MSFNLDGYTTVNERIIQFYDKHPDGVISTHPAKIVEVGGNIYISVLAEVMTSPDGVSIVAEAWETYPGKTPYTRDSEMMNAATSAIGRALMQLGIGVDKAAASADEVRARTPMDTIKDKATAEKPSEWERPDKRISNGAKPVSERQVKLIYGKCKAAGLNTVPDMLQAVSGLLGRTVGSLEEIYSGEVDAIVNAGTDGLQAARFKSMGLTVEPIGTTDAGVPILAEVTADDDPWAVEKW